MGITKILLSPPAPDRCPVCAAEHEPEEPHNAESFYYRVCFFQQHGRYPTWDDALAHCEPGFAETWRAVMTAFDPEWESKPPC